MGRGTKRQKTEEREGGYSYIDGWIDREIDTYRERVREKG